jgi:integrase
MGKRGVVKSLDDYVDRREAGLVRSYVTTIDKSWVAAGVDAAAKIAEIAAEYPRVAVQLKLQAAFGLRIEESFSLKPAFALRNEDTLQITHGTKGGRERLVPTQLRLAVLEEAMTLVDPARGSTTPANYTIARWRGHYNFVLAKFGISKKGLGVTSHGLRHQWLQEYYETLTGVLAPVKGSAERAPLEEHRAALLSAVEAAGHSRPSKTGAYLSTHKAMEKKEARRVTKQEAEEALETSNGNKSRAAERLGISRLALYRALGRTY